MTTNHKTNGDLDVAPEDRGIQDAYWRRFNDNPYDFGTPEHNRYEDAFKSEMERLTNRERRISDEADN